MPLEEQKRDVESAKASQQMDSRAFAQEYQTVYRRMWLIAAGLTGSGSDADDIVQAAAVVAFRRLAEFRPGSSFSAWLAEIVRRSALNHRRKVTRRKTFATDPTELDQQIDWEEKRDPQLAGGLEEIVSEIDDDMLRVLSQLPEEARCCLLLRVIDGLSYAEISDMLGIPKGTAMSHVHRSKSFARARLKGRAADVRDEK